MIDPPTKTNQCGVLDSINCRGSRVSLCLRSSAQLTTIAFSKTYTHRASSYINRDLYVIQALPTKRLSTFWNIVLLISGNVKITFFYQRNRSKWPIREQSMIASEWTLIYATFKTSLRTYWVLIDKINTTSPSSRSLSGSGFKTCQGPLPNLGLSNVVRTKTSNTTGFLPPTIDLNSRSTNFTLQ
jgi:hypothetical protein